MADDGPLHKRKLIVGDRVSRGAAGRAVHRRPSPVVDLVALCVDSISDRHARSPLVLAIASLRKAHRVTPLHGRVAPLQDEEIASRQQRASAHVEIVAALDRKLPKFVPLSRTTAGCRPHLGRLSLTALSVRQSSALATTPGIRGSCCTALGEISSELGCPRAVSPEAAVFESGLSCFDPSMPT